MCLFLDDDVAQVEFKSQTCIWLSCGTLDISLSFLTISTNMSEINLKKGKLCLCSWFWKFQITVGWPSLWACGKTAHHRRTAPYRTAHHREEDTL